MRDTTREQLRAAIFEASFVVLGVILALAANEWLENRASAARARHALASIIEELQTNRDAVQASFDYHTGVLEVIRQAVKTSDPPGLETFSRGFVSAANLQRTAWDSASATGAFEDIGFSKILELSRVYAQQQRYEQQVAGISPIIYEELYRGGTRQLLENYRNLSGLINTFVYRESQLLTLYDETSRAFGVESDASAPSGG